MKERTALRRSWRRDVAWEAEMPPSLSESPLEERHSSGLDLPTEREVVRCTYCIYGRYFKAKYHIYVTMHRLVSLIKNEAERRVAFHTREHTWYLSDSSLAAVEEVLEPCEADSSSASSSSLLCFRGEVAVGALGSLNFTVWTQEAGLSPAATELVGGCFA